MKIDYIHSKIPESKAWVELLKKRNIEFNISRDKGARKGCEKGINFKFWFILGKNSLHQKRFDFDYTKGIGHFTNKSHFMNEGNYSDLRAYGRTYIYWVKDGGNRTEKLTINAPSLEEVIVSLIQDSDTPEFFEDFVSEFGYEAREGESIITAYDLAKEAFDGCRKAKQFLLYIFTEERLMNLQEQVREL